MISFYTIISFDHPNERDAFYETYQLPDRRLSIGWGFDDPRRYETEDALFQMITNGFDVVPDTNHNARNGSRSLHLFKQVLPGDIVFVRGDAQIIDVVRIMGVAEYNPELMHHEWYYTYLPFEPLRPGNQIYFPVSEMEEALRKEFVFEKGRPRVFKKLDNDVGVMLLSNIISRM